jgi:3-deoxy-7-phosphoheptulonate synthase
VLANHTAVEDILARRDHRMMLILGPCSIHDVEAAHEYADRLARLAREVNDSFVVLMRVYFEKPRTSVGWKGFINDPDLDDSFKIEEGLVRARRLLRDIAELGLGSATEALDPITPQYLDDLIAWTAIGARTTESQTHREMASGLSTPEGFKNGTDGNIEVALNALTSVSQPHRFLGVNQDGQCAVMETRGNANAHIVLRGGHRPNYDSVSILLCERALVQRKLAPNIVVDCSHGNSLKDPSLQPLVMEDCVRQIEGGNQSIVGLMLESHLHFENQSLNGGRAALKYGVSVTDACIDWETTESLVRRSHERLKDPLRERSVR